MILTTFEFSVCTASHNQALIDSWTSRLTYQTHVYYTMCSTHYTWIQSKKILKIYEPAMPVLEAQLEETLAAVEGADHCLTFSSGLMKYIDIGD